MIKIRSKYPSEGDVSIITLCFGLAGARAESMAGLGGARGGLGGAHGRRGPKATHAQVDAPHMTYLVLNKANTLNFGYF